MRRIVERFDPDLVIVMLGENDHQSLQTVHGDREAQIGTSEWPPTYRERVLRMMRIATSNGAKVVWAGLPISARLPAPGAFEAAERDLRIRREHLKRRRLLRRMGALPRADGPGTPRTSARAGRVILIREGDGLHFNAIGYTILAREIAKLAVEEFGLSPRTFETAI